MGLASVMPYHFRFLWMFTNTARRRPIKKYKGAAEPPPSLAAEAHQRDQGISGQIVSQR